MSKKRAKSGAGSAGVQRWETGLLTTPFAEEDKWNASLAFVVGNRPEDYENLQHLIAVVNSGTRRLFSIFSKNELYEMVNDLGNPKSKKAKEIPQFYEVCEPCKMHLDNNEEIPLPLLAKLLKFRLLDIKQKDLKRRESEKKNGADKDKGGKKGDKGKERGKSAGKGKGGKKTPEPPSAKGETKLKKRGEEDTDNKYIDDEPDDGPQHYIMICGFHQPHLLSHLAELNICVDSIIKLSSEDYARFQPSPEDEDLDIEKDEKQLILEDEQRRVKELLSGEMELFWKDILLLLQAAPPGSPLHDVAQLEYIIKNEILPQNFEDNDQKTQFGTAMFEDMACMMYDLLDSKRQWKNYLANLHLIHVPEYGQPPASEIKDSQTQPCTTPAPPASQKPDNVSQPGDASEVKMSYEVDMRFYNDMMNAVPQESVSVPLIMHCMLEQVVASEEGIEPPSETPHPPRSDGLDDNVAQHISSLAFKLALSEEEQQALSAELDPVKPTEPILKQPLLLNYHDDITRRLNHLKPVDKFDAMAAELSMLGYLPVANLHHFKQPSAKVAKERAARLQELLHFCVTGGLTQLEIEHAMRQFVLECVELSGTTEEGLVSIWPQGFPQYNIPWDHPYPYFQGMIPTADEEEAGPDDMEEEPKATGRKSRPRSARSAASPDKGASPSPPSSRPHSPGILKSGRAGSATSRKSHSTHSVHFEKDADGNMLAQPGDEVPPEEQEEVILPPEPDADGIVPEGSDPMETINDGVQKRVLDQWCFAEHLEPKILQQVMSKALDTHPYVDTYYHRRDNTLLVVVHNPHTSELQSRTKWENSLHSDVGFRNYMDHVADSIEEWNRGEEAKYQATLLAKEVDQIVREAEEASSRPASGKGKKKDRSKSPKKSPSRAGKSPSRSSSVERPSSSNPYVRQGSLKAWKEEQDKVKAEEEEKERQKQEKRARSAEKKKQAKEAQEKEEKESKGKRPGSRQSSKSRMSKEDTIAPQEPTQEQICQPDEPYWPFTGYDVGNDLIHASGSLTTLFPADGGQIRVEKTGFTQGTVSVKTSILKDGHSFTVHVLDPKEAKKEEEKTNEENGDAQNAEEVEKAELETQEKDEENAGEEEAELKTEGERESKKPCVGRFGSFVARFNDGLTLGISTYGNSGLPVDGGKYEPAPYVVPPIRTPSPQGKGGDSPTKNKREKGKDKSQTPEPVSQTESELPKDEEPEDLPLEEPVPDQPFQQLNLSCPDGLHLTYCLESSLGIPPKSEDSRHILVRQAYPFKTKGIQACEASRKAAMEEVSRVINAEGTVIKTCADGSNVVMYADGTVSQYCMASPLIPGSRSSSPMRAGSARSDRETPTKKKGGRKSANKAKDAAQEVPVEEDPAEKAFWITTLPTGERIATQGPSNNKVPVKTANVCVATDPQSGQTMHSRDDHVVTIYMPDGSTIVEHADGTRITTMHHEVEIKVETEDSQETGEDGAVEVKQVKLVSVECPGYATVKFDSHGGHCSTELGNGDSVFTALDGTYDIHHNDGACLHIEPDGTSVYFPSPNNDVDMPNPTQQLQYIMRHFTDVVCETVDNMGNTFSVTNMGETSVVMAPGQETVTMETEDEEKVVQKVVMYKQHAPRFFILHPDGSGTELLRYQDVANYIAQAEDDPASAILMDPLPDHPGVIGITVLKPCTKGISESWLKTYEVGAIIPPGLVSRDFRSLPAKEFKKDGPKFGTNVGQGLAIGSAVKAPSAPPALKCPAVLQLRQILQYKPVTQELRDKLGTSLKNYAEYIKSRMNQKEALKVVDPRSDEEKMAAEDLQAAAALNSTLIPGPVQGDVKELYEKVTAPAIPSPPPTPQPKRSKADWERDVRELAEEQVNKRALREHDVPKYFDSELGKSFLLSQAPDLEALTKQLAEETRHGGHQGIRSSSDTTSSQISPDQNHPQDAAGLRGVPESVASTVTPSATFTDISPSPIRGVTGNTPSALRPGNPTPAHAQGEGSPAPVRPSNPTPAHASKAAPDRPIAPSPKDASNGFGFASETPSSHAYPSIPEQPYEEATQQQPDDDLVPSTNNNIDSAHHYALNVYGEPRKDQVHVPAYMKTGRPGAIPNQKFYEIEDPVRRKMNTLSLTGATPQGKKTLGNMRGFELLPDTVDFGVLREGSTYAVIVHMKNTGIDTCRFKIKQPPPSTGLQVIFKPGPVAAGLKVELTIEIYAIAAGVQGIEGIGSINHNLEITTETHHMYLPISATVLTADEFDRQAHSTPRCTPGVRLVSSRPPAGQGIIRSRRDQGPEMVR